MGFSRSSSVLRLSICCWFVFITANRSTASCSRNESNDFSLAISACWMFCMLSCSAQIKSFCVCATRTDSRRISLVFSRRDFSSSSFSSRAESSQCLEVSSLHCTRRLLISVSFWEVDCKIVIGADWGMQLVLPAPSRRVTQYWLLRIACHGCSGYRSSSAAGLEVRGLHFPFPPWFYSWATWTFVLVAPWWLCS